MPCSNFTQTNSGVPEEDMEQANRAESTRKSKWESFKNALICILIIIIICLSVALAIKHQKQSCIVVSPIQACPESWIGYKGNCYYFSKEERNWSSSQTFCSLYNASLARIEKKDQDFVMLNKGKGSCWIDLRRNPGQPWKWSNGDNSTLEIVGEGSDCAYLNDDTKASSSRCNLEHCWICRKSSLSTGPHVN